MEKVKVHHYPEDTTTIVKIEGRSYISPVLAPKVFVVEGLETKNENIEFTDLKGELKFKLTGCLYTELENKTLIECRIWEMIYIEHTAKLTS